MISFSDLLMNLSSMFPYYCSCPIQQQSDHQNHRQQEQHEHIVRWLFQQEEENNTTTSTRLTENTSHDYWKMVLTVVVLLLMLIAFLSDSVGADSVMIAALTVFIVSGVITVQQGLSGFANEGLASVMVLFVVAEGISKTGALDWYMGKLLGKPKNLAVAQLRLMIPIACVSAFVSNTPLVVIMIPIVQRWGQTIGISYQQLMIPLSFATILGGTCTLMGTSTNLVVKGLYESRYPDEPPLDLFGLTQYAVPVTLVGISYMLLFAKYLLPGRKKDEEGVFLAEVGTSDAWNPLDDTDKLLLGAKCTPWSPAVGRSVKRSGLRNTGGIYLVSVYRSTTGEVHRAVGQDFILNAGDILYFTSAGFVEDFGEFCDDHGLEVFTNETEQVVIGNNADNTTATTVSTAAAAATVDTSQHHEDMIDIPFEIGVTSESLRQADETELIRSIHEMTDMIRGGKTPFTFTSELNNTVDNHSSNGNNFLMKNEPTKIIVTTDHNNLVVVALNASNRSGLLLDVSKALLELNLQVHHTEGRVIRERVLSIWRCEPTTTGNKISSNFQSPDKEEIWSALNALVESDSGCEAVKKRGLKVIRARVTPGSTLVGKTAEEVGFRKRYQAAIVAVQRKGKNVNQSLSIVRFQAEDLLILQTSDTSPLLLTPPEDFYDDTAEAGTLLKKNDDGDEQKEVKDDLLDYDGDEEGLENGRGDEKVVWRDLQTLVSEIGVGVGEEFDIGVSKEFLTAMVVSPKSSFINKTARTAGIDILPGVVLVGIERPNQQRLLASSRKPSTSDAESIFSYTTMEGNYTEVPLDAPLNAGDYLWFAGTASAVGELRRIPGLVSYLKDEVEKIDEKVFDRRLVQAVVAQKGSLVGKTVKEAQFRTKFGAAVIAVHRDGNRIHTHPGKIRLKAGDVLLLEAGSTFLASGAENDRSFALLAEVKDSAPPRLYQLFPALIITVSMLIICTSGLESLTTAALVAAIVMVSFRILSEQEARDSIHWDVFILIGSAFGIGAALVNSGVSAVSASFLVSVGEALGIGDAGLLGSVYLATFLVSNVVTNSAAAALIFPIAMDVADKTGVNSLMMTYCLTLGASASFMSPFGYTTNLLVYGPGGYKYKDFLMIGIPMQILLWLTTVTILAFPSITLTWWGLSSLIFLVTMITRFPLYKLFTVSSTTGVRHCNKSPNNEPEIEWRDEFALLTKANRDTL